VVQATLRVVKVFWGLDDKLANARHFPAVNWLISYSLYHDNIKEYLKGISSEFADLKKDAMRLLEEESSLLEIARLVGIESLSDEDRLTLETAKSIREDFLHQNAFHEVDTYTSLKKQYLMLKMILSLHKTFSSLIKAGRDLKDLFKLPIRGKIAKCKYIPETQLDEFQEISQEIDALNMG
jgi:V/A-type H+-transporting ATPase subunit A